MKTKYQNNYSDKFTLFKNIINNKNNNENFHINININNNREYYNPIDEYEIIENNKGISTRINNNNINNEYIK